MVITSQKCRSTHPAVGRFNHQFQLAARSLNGHDRNKAFDVVPATCARGSLPFAGTHHGIEVTPVVSFTASRLRRSCPHAASISLPLLLRTCALIPFARSTPWNVNTSCALGRP